MNDFSSPNRPTATLTPRSQGQIEFIAGCWFFFFGLGAWGSVATTMARRPFAAKNAAGKYATPATKVSTHSVVSLFHSE